MKLLTTFGAGELKWMTTKPFGVISMPEEASLYLRQCEQTELLEYALMIAETGYDAMNLSQYSICKFLDGTFCLHANYVQACILK